MLDPIITRLAQHIVRDGASLRLHAPEVVEAELERLRGTPRAASAVLALVALAAHVEGDLGDVTLADALLALAAHGSGAAEVALTALHGDRADRARAARARLVAFTGAHPAAPVAIATGDRVRVGAMHTPTVFR